MSTSPSKDSPTPPQPKSKQERIRDNQRRSRARRQEYLADLEKRLSECQITAREADVQRAAFIELQIENARLRELLALANINEQFVDQYVSQAIIRSGQTLQGTNPALRQLKPKMSPIDGLRPFTYNTVPSNAPDRLPSTPSVMSASPAAQPIIMQTPVMPSSFTPPPLYNSISLNNGQDMGPNMTPMASYDWPYQQSASIHSQESLEDFSCDTFGIMSKGPTKRADENSVLCTVAKQMIGQYKLSPADLENVKSKLAEGHCRPSFPGSSCAITNQTLFQILHDLNTRYT